MSNRQQVGEREDNEVVDGGGGGELGHREQRNCSQQVNHVKHRKEKEEIVKGFVDRLRRKDNKGTHARNTD